MWIYNTLCSMRILIYLNQFLKYSDLKKHLRWLMGRKIYKPIKGMEDTKLNAC